MIIFINVDKIIFINATVIGRRICYIVLRVKNRKISCRSIMNRKLGRLDVVQYSAFSFTFVKCIYSMTEFILIFCVCFARNNGKFQYISFLRNATGRLDVVQNSAFSFFVCEVHLQYDRGSYLNFL
jgi:hypothetical protein